MFMSKTCIGYLMSFKINCTAKEFRKKISNCDTFQMRPLSVAVLGTELQEVEANSASEEHSKTRWFDCAQSHRLRAERRPAA
jgi:hypothetical protein